MVLDIRFIFTPDPWGFMIQFDLRIFFNWVGEKPPTSSPSKTKIKVLLKVSPQHHATNNLQIRILHIIPREKNQPTNPTNPTNPTIPTQPSQPTQPTNPTRLFLVVLLLQVAGLAHSEFLLLVYPCASPLDWKKSGNLGAKQAEIPVGKANGSLFFWYSKATYFKRV